MAYEFKPNEGSLFKNEDKAEGDSRPHMKGSGLIEIVVPEGKKPGDTISVPVWLSAWTNTKKGSSERWQKVTWKAKEPRVAAPAEPAEPAPPPADFDDDIPF